MIELMVLSPSNCLIHLWKKYLYEVLTSLWLIKTSSISEVMSYDVDDGALIGNWCKTNLAPTPNTFYIDTYISYKTFEKVHNTID